jgi:hypothetical protein
VAIPRPLVIVVTEIDFGEIRAQVDRGELRKSDVWSAVNSASRKGDAEATFTLGYRYYRLRGKDHEKTRWWLAKAAEMGHSEAAEMLAEIDRESLEKRESLISAAKAGDLSAQVNLAHILGDNWDGLGLDLDQSRYWFLQASLQGSQSAQYHLGLMFLRGEGGPADVDKGVHWLEKAAFGITYSGAEVLADLYEVGSHGLPRDLERANYWRARLRQADQLRYFKYFCDVDLGEELAGWGTSWWYVEADGHGNVSRVLQSYAAGQVLRYDEQVSDDADGGLPEGCVDLEEIQELEISRDEFFEAWNELPSFNRPWGDVS